ncbi:hypothetical protein MMC07_008983 [Pseudocyphellaria aurata]|nr:hypothetical protein [Pseudocyphellaria aurata]
MAAAISAINAKIRSQPVLSYFCSTRKLLNLFGFLRPVRGIWALSTNASFRIDFWGPASNFGIPVAAVLDIKKDPEIYGGREESLKLKAKNIASEGADYVQEGGREVIQKGKETFTNAKDALTK